MYKLLLLFLFISCQGYSQLSFHSDIEMGYEDRSLLAYSLTERDVYDMLKNNLYNTICISSEIKGFKAYVENKVWFKSRNPFSYEPSMAHYKMGASYKYKFMTIGYEHKCLHGVRNNLINDAYDRISIKFNIF